jgi:menaquinone-9 beta-reductase
MDHDIPKYDVLILGGGPAGLSTALHLHQLAPQLSRRILLLEKGHYPRPKLCAGGLVADAEVILEGLGLDVSEVPHVDASAAHFDFGGKGLTVSVPKRHTLRIIRRDEFDAWLAKNAETRGIEIREGVTVKNVKADEKGVTVITDQGEFRAQVVVGADGSNGVTRRCVFPDAPVHTARLLEVLTPQADVIASERSERGNLLTNGGLPRRGSAAPRNDTRHAYFDFFPIPAGIAGYTWDFPTQVNGQPMRCWGIYDTNLLAHKGRPALKEPLAEEMARHGFDLSQHELKGHPIRWYSPRNPVSVPRVLLVGDAVGADGIFGEGISMALAYGKVAAGELVQAFSTGDFSFSGYRRRLSRSALGRTLFVRWVITKILYRLHWAWFQKWFWRFWKPLILAFAWVFVLNWGKRLKP